VQNFNRFGNFGLSVAPKCVWGRAPPAPAGGAIALSRAPSRYEGDGKANERFANNEGGEWGYGISEGWEGIWRDGKGNGGMGR